MLRLSSVIMGVTRMLESSSTDWKRNFSYLRSMKSRWWWNRNLNTILKKLKTGFSKWSLNLIQKPAKFSSMHLNWIWRCLTNSNLYPKTSENSCIRLKRANTLSSQPTTQRNRSRYTALKRSPEIQTKHNRGIHISTSVVRASAHFNQTSSRISLLIRTSRKQSYARS